MNTALKPCFAHVATAAVLSCADVAQAYPLTLPIGDVVVLDYSGYETVHHGDEDTRLGVGDSFDGLIRIDRIRNSEGTVDLSSQLSDVELTGTFQFHINATSPPAHLEFAPGIFRLFVSTAAMKNFDPTATDAVARATDGTPWVEVSPGSFFVSVNDPFNGAPRNRTWLDISQNWTGYELARAEFPALLGRDPTHLYDGMMHGDHFVHAYFEDFPAPSDLAPYSFKIHGQIYIKPVPEPSSLVLLMSGLVVLLSVLRSMRARRGPSSEP